MPNAKSLIEQWLGPDANYSGNVPSPEELGVGDAPTMTQLSHNVAALMNYATVMVDGCNGNAKNRGLCKIDDRPEKAARKEKERQCALARENDPNAECFVGTREGYDGAIYPLGNKFFLKTMGTCTDINTGEQVDRYIYINNVPTGKIDLGVTSIGKQGAGFRGLIGSVMEDMGRLNPMGLFKGFEEGGIPNCKPVQLEIIDSNGNKSLDTKHLALSDILELDPDAFTTMNNKKLYNMNQQINKMTKLSSINTHKISDSDNTYVLFFNLFVIYLLVKLLSKY